MYDTTLEPTQPEPAARKPRGVLAVVGSVVAVVLVSGAGYAAWQFFGTGGSRPAEVLPDSTVALLSVDLDPSGGQKIEAIKTLRKLPSWNKRVGATADTDLVKAIFDEAVKDSPCKALDYERDVKPWIGQRAAVGGVLLGDGTTVPVLALQVTDSEKARSGFAEVASCSQSKDDFGWALADGYIVGSDSTQHAEVVVAAGRKTPLSASADYQKWTEESGGAGIVNAYAGPKAGVAFADLLGSQGNLGAGGEDPSKELAKTLKDFKGAAATVRFADGGLELSYAAGGRPGLEAGPVGEHVAALPKDTAAALAVSVPAKAWDQQLGSDAAFGGLLEGFTSSTGLKVPEDLVTLFGDSLSISLGGDAPADLDAIRGPQDVPFGLLTRGDEAKIRAVITKVERRTGLRLSELPATVASGEHKVAIASSADYAQQLLADGSLADSETFQGVVPELARAQAVAYVSFDNGWVSALRKSAAVDKDPDTIEVMDDVAALRALGISSWADGDVSRGLVRISLR